jgi:hypothetical protein
MNICLDCVRMTDMAFNNIARRQWFQFLNHNLVYDVFMLRSLMAPDVLLMAAILCYVMILGTFSSSKMEGNV